MPVRETVIEALIRDEGLELKPYRDSVGKLTIGVDRNLDDKGISESEARMLLADGGQQYDLTAIINEVRRQSYNLNDDGRFDVEYADVLGVPFDFTVKPAVAPPQPPRETAQVMAVSPDHDACEVRFPRVAESQNPRAPMAAGPSPSSRRCMTYSPISRPGRQRLKHIETYTIIVCTYLVHYKQESWREEP